MRERFFSLLRVCCICGANTGQNSLYCFGCRTREEQLALSERAGDSLFYISNSNKDHRYRQLIGLKERPCPILVSWLMRLMLKKKVLWGMELPNSPLVVPAPSSTGRDHAHRLAKELCEQTGWEMQDVLEKEMQTQKARSQYDRSEVQVSLKENMPGKRNVVLVDDLITTGSTARACEKVFKNIKSFEVWAPYRSLLLYSENPFAITQQDEKDMDCNTFNISYGQW